jgi:hypothetical protein
MSILPFKPIKAEVPDQHVEVGRWYLASYGFSHVSGRCVAILPDGLLLSFRWGGPFRERKFVGWHSIHGEVPDPRWFSRFRR